jgi:N6-adenosine-specific RNA methylase IME4
MTKYSVVYADPPWMYYTHYDSKTPTRENNDVEGTPSDHYQTMSLEELKQFPINDFADEKNCVLFLWCTAPKLPIALEFCEKNGFTYHCLITWNKRDGLSFLGFYRVTEYCIYAYRGRMGIKKDGKAFPTLIQEQSKGHSKKPDSFFEHVRNKTEEPRISIFERKHRFGFSSHGNQAEAPKPTLEMFN